MIWLNGVHINYSTMIKFRSNLWYDWCYQYIVPTHLYSIYALKYWVSLNLTRRNPRISRVFQFEILFGSYIYCKPYQRAMQLTKIKMEMYNVHATFIFIFCSIDSSQKWLEKILMLNIICWYLRECAHFFHFDGITVVKEPRSTMFCQLQVQVI